MSDSPASREATDVRPARLRLFGHEATSATAEVIRRSRRWRTARALRALLAGVVVAPVVLLVPPHAPWAIGTLAGGAFIARRRFQERVTLISARGSCPRCGEEVCVEGPTRLRAPHPVACESCGHESALDVSIGEPPTAA